MNSILQHLRNIAGIGGWVVVSLFFMGQAAGYIQSPFQVKLEEHDARAEGIRLSLEAHRARQEQLIEKLTTALRVMCENGAKTAVELNNCRNIH